MAPSAIAEHAVEEVQNKVVVPKPIERIPLPKLEAKGKAGPLEDHGEIQTAFVPLFKSRPSRRKSLQERLARAEAGRIYIAARHGDHRSNPDRPVFHGYNQHQAVCGGDAGDATTSPTAAGDWRDDSGRGLTPQVYQQRQTACANRDSQAHRRNQRSATGAGKRRWCRGWRPGRRAGRPDGWSDWRCAWWSIEHGS